MNPSDERDNVMHSRRRQRALWMLVLGGLVMALLLAALAPETQGSSQPSASPASPASAEGAVGTAGAHDEASGMADAAIVREIETITGANDASSLVGRRVDLHVDVQARANDHAFWVGSADNRVLVVLARDNRTRTHRQTGSPGTHGISPVREGQRAAISGTIQPMPKAEHRFNWDLTERDQQELRDRKIYIRADSVRPEGHGVP